MPPHAVQTEAIWETEPIHRTGDSSVTGNKNNAAGPLVSSSSSRLRKPSVRFLETVSFREIAPLTELSEIEIASVWYNDDEYAKIKKHVSATIKKFASNGDSSIKELDGYCMRGLEGRTKFGARRRKNNKAAALDSVWQTQISLWRRKVADNLDAAIAAAYKPHSMHAKYPAIETAMIDEKYAKENYYVNMEQATAR